MFVMVLIVVSNEAELNNIRVELILVPNDVELNNIWMQLILVSNDVELNNGRDGVDIGTKRCRIK